MLNFRPRRFDLVKVNTDVSMADRSQNLRRSSRIKTPLKYTNEDEEEGRFEEAGIFLLFFRIIIFYPEWIQLSHTLTSHARLTFLTHELNVAISVSNLPTIL